MGTSMIAAAAITAADTFDDNVTWVLPVHGLFRDVNGTASHAVAGVPIRVAGDIADFKTYVHANTVLASSTVTVFASGVASALSVTYGSGETGEKTDTDTVAVAATDELSCELAVGNDAGGAKTIRLDSMSLEYTTADADTHACIGPCGTDIARSTDSTTWYWAGGACGYGASTTELSTYATSAVALSNLYVTVDANSRSTNTAFRVRVNGGNGNQTVTFAAAETGAKEDTSNTDALADGDAFGWAMTTGTGGGSINPYSMVCVSETADRRHYMNAGNTSGEAYSTTDYSGLSGGLDTNTTEAQAQTRVPFAGTLSGLRAYAAANTSSSSSTVNARVEGATVDTITFGVGETGLKESSGAVAFADDDLLGFQIAQGGTGSITLTVIALDIQNFAALTASPTDSITLSDSASTAMSFALSKTDSIALTDSMTTDGFTFTPFSGTRTFVGVGELATALGAASAGDVLVLAEGTHDVSTNVPAGVTIRGVCGDSTILNVTSTIELGNSVTIRDLTVTATGVAFDLSAGSTWFDGVTFGGCSVSVLGPPSGSTATFHRCTFEGTTEDHWYRHEGADPGATTFKACLFLSTVAGSQECLYWQDFTGDTTGLVVLFENCTIINTVARGILSLDTYDGTVTYTNNVVQSVNDSFFGDASGHDTGSGNYSNQDGQGEAYVTTVPDLHLHAYAPTNKSPFRNAVSASGFDRNHLPLSTSAGCYQWREQGSAIYKPRFLNPVNGIVFSYDGNTFTGSTEALVAQSNNVPVRQVYDHLEVACRVRQYVQDLTHPSLGRFWVTADGYYRLTVDVGTFDLVISSPASRIFGTANLNDVDDTD